MSKNEGAHAAAQPHVISQRQRTALVLVSLALLALLADPQWQPYVVFPGEFAAPERVLLTASTPVAELLHALRTLRVPRLLVATVFFTYRYFHVVGDEAMRMMRARDSRSAALPDRRAGGTVAWRASVLGHMVGSLFIRSLDRSERVYAAMQARGYRGDQELVMHTDSYELNSLFCLEQAESGGLSGLASSFTASS